MMTTRDFAQAVAKDTAEIQLEVFDHRLTTSIVLTNVE